MPAFSRPLLNMMECVYLVRDFDEHFETSETRKLVGPLRWVAIPTKHDGRSYKRATRLKHCVEALCGWWSMLQVAAKMPIRGLLADRSGPLDAQDIADKTNLPKKIYLTTFSAMSDEQIGWLQQLPWDPNHDFRWNVENLIGHQHLPADALRHQRTPADTSGHQRTKKQSSSDGGTSRHQQPPADSSTSAATPADSSGPQQIAEDPSLQYKTDSTRQIPPTVPQGGQEAVSDSIGFTEAKQLLHQLFRREKRHWSHEEEQLLSAAVPISRSEWPMIETWFRLPLDHPVFQVTKRKQELTTFLREFNGEIDKMRAHAPLFMESNFAGAPSAKKEPVGWREFFREKYGADCVLPARFDQLPADQRREWDREGEDWKRKKGGAE